MSINPSQQDDLARKVRLIVIHCSATPNDRTLFAGEPNTPGWRTPAMEIDAWHAERGFHRDSYWRGRCEPSLMAIGYHFVIARNGALFNGRHLDEVGAHAQGWNAPSVGICLVGTDSYTIEQWETLEAVVSSLARKLYSIPTDPPEFSPQQGYLRTPGVCGHRDLPGVSKDCPGFDVATWLDGGMRPLTKDFSRSNSYART